MEMGSELSKTVATFIVQKILLDDVSGWLACLQDRADLAVLLLLMWGWLMWGLVC